MADRTCSEVQLSVELGEARWPCDSLRLPFSVLISALSSLHTAVQLNTRPFPCSSPHARSGPMVRRDT